MVDDKEIYIQQITITTGTEYQVEICHIIQTIWVDKGIKVMVDNNVLEEPLHPMQSWVLIKEQNHDGDRQIDQYSIDNKLYIIYTNCFSVQNILVIFATLLTLNLA
jgi:hypothetical protein